MQAFHTIVVSPHLPDNHAPENGILYLNDLESLSRLNLSEVETILLEGGHTYHGMLLLTGLSQPLLVLSRGERPAILDAGEGSGVQICECRNLTLAGFRVSGCGWRNSKDTYGIRLLRCEQVQVLNCEVSGFSHGGIVYESCGQLQIKGCYSHDNGNAGIAGLSGERPSEDIYIGYCKAYNNGGTHNTLMSHTGSGIMLYQTQRAVVEYCEAAGNGWAQRQTNHNGPVGIWCACGCSEVVFRWCISRYNRTQPGAVDGDGFDFDGSVVDSEMVNNLSYDNEGSGYLLCEYGSGEAWSGNHVRSCISVNDAFRVSQHGSIVLYAPPHEKMEDSLVERCLIVAADGRVVVQNVDIDAFCKDIRVQGNTFLPGACGVTAVSNPNVSVQDNAVVEDESLRVRLNRSIRPFSNPEQLPSLPVSTRLSDPPGQFAQWFAD